MKDAAVCAENDRSFVQDFCPGKEIDEEIHCVNMYNVAISDVTKNLGRNRVTI